MGEHDKRFKPLLREFLGDFLHLFFPDRAARFDFGSVEWLDKEMHPDPPAGDVSVLDLVARLRLRADGAAEAALALLHLEVESKDGVAAFRERMFRYYAALRDRYKLPVLPVAVYLRAGFDGVGVDEYAESFDGLDVLRFRFLYVGLPALDAEAYATGPSPLGAALSGLMKSRPGRRPALQAESLRRILEESALGDYRKFLLTECAEAYYDLADEERGAFLRVLSEERFRGVRAMFQTTYERARAEFLTTGRAEGQRLAVRRVLEHKFGPLPPDAAGRLDAAPADRLPDLLIAAVEAKALADVAL